MAKTIVMPKKKKKQQIEELVPQLWFFKRGEREGKLCEICQISVYTQPKKKKGSQPINAPKALITKKKKNFSKKDSIIPEYQYCILLHLRDPRSLFVSK